MNGFLSHTLAYAEPAGQLVNAMRTREKDLDRTGWRKEKCRRRKTVCVMSVAQNFEQNSPHHPLSAPSLTLKQYIHTHVRNIILHWRA